MQNPYLPKQVKINKITDETEAKDIKTFDLVFFQEKDREEFAAKHIPGQFAELSLLGAGEIPIGIASSPTEAESIKFTIKKAGTVTTDLHNSEAGRFMGVRGPLGNGFPLEYMKGKNIVVVGGGFAFTTLRAWTVYALNHRELYKDITIIYGARTPGDLIYKQELADWEKRSDLNLNVTVDRGDQTWKGRQGFVPAVTKEVAPSSEDAVAIVCGPPIMIKFTIPVLFDLGFKPENIINSLEMRMKCGVGKCGRCNIGNKFVCKDGPVFTYKELQEMPQEY
ncbi:MAG: FAD/NAD(P)-binding protein [bacterium]